MSNQLSNEFILNTAPPIALNDGNSLVPQQLVHGQVNSAVNDGTTTIWPNVANSNANEIGYNLLLNSDQQVNYSANNLTQIQGQDMSQTAQIVLLPTQNINLVANVPKQEQVQMILPNDVGYQLITSIPSVSVLVPTNLLLTNGYILIPNSPNSCPNLPIDSLASEQSSQTVVSSNQNQVYLKQWVDSGQVDQPPPQQQIIAANVEFEQSHTPQIAQEQDCEYIALAETGTQTVLSGITDAELNQTAHLLSNNGQIVGIIGGDQLGILQTGEAGSENQVLLAACIDPNESINLVSQVENGGAANNNSYDINAILASTISTLGVGKSDQNQAKQWLKDSYIVNRALKALKKTNTGSHHHHSSRPHPQVRR